MGQTFEQVAPKAVREGSPVPAQPANPEYQLVALGLFDDQGKPQTVWKVNNQQDMGVAVRLAALEGRIDMGVMGDQNKISVLRVWLGGAENKLSRSLLY